MEKDLETRTMEQFQKKTPREEGLGKIVDETLQNQEKKSTKKQSHFKRIWNYITNGAIMGGLASIAIAISGLLNTSAILVSYLLARKLFWKGYSWKKTIYRALLTAIPAKPILDATVYLINPVNTLLKAAYRTVTALGLVYPWSIFQYRTLEHLVNNYNLKSFTKKIITKPFGLVRDTYNKALKGKYVQTLKNAYRAYSIPSLINYWLTPPQFVIPVGCALELIGDTYFFHLDKKSRPGKYRSVKY